MNEAVTFAMTCEALCEKVAAMSQALARETERADKAEAECAELREQLATRRGGNGSAESSAATDATIVGS